jgi:hypothetical protein
MSGWQDAEPGIKTLPVIAEKYLVMMAVVVMVVVVSCVVLMNRFSRFGAPRDTQRFWCNDRGIHLLRGVGQR